MWREPVESDAVSSIGYDDERELLEIEFREGRVYQYLDVPETTYMQLMRAESVGNFVATKIKPNFEVRPL